MGMKALHPVIDGRKACSKCGQNKRLDEFSVNRARKSGGRSASCKACVNEYTARRRKALVRKPTVDRKECKSCGVTKIAKDFRKIAMNADGLHTSCKTCENSRKAEYNRRYRATPEGRSSVALHRMVRRLVQGDRSGVYKRLGYSLHDLREHLERQFQAGMSWDNYGDWHIDHIVPVSSFVSKGIEDPKIVNALSNLRPLWASENFAKGASCEVMI